MSATDGVNEPLPSSDDDMQADVDAHAAAMEAQRQQQQAAAPQQQQPQATDTMVQQMMQMIMQKIMEQVSNAFTQNVGQPAGVQGPGSSGVPSGPTPWQIDPKMANVRLDIKAFSRIDKFTDKKEEWTEWRAQVIEAVRECDRTFADEMVNVYEKKEKVITNDDLTPVQQQLSGVLQSRLVNLTGKEAFAIVRAADGQGVEAWRQLLMRFDPQTDARFVTLLISVISFKIGTKQDVQSGLVKWEAMLLALERDHKEALSPKIRRALLLNILPQNLQNKLMEHLDRLTDYKEVRDKILFLVQSRAHPEAMDCGLLQGDGVPSVHPEDEEEGAEGYTEEEELQDLAALADITCRRCNKKGHFARNCKQPPPRGQNGQFQATRFASSYTGPSSVNRPGPRAPQSGDKPTCSTCKKTGHTKEECWQTYPEKIPAKFKKDKSQSRKIQSLESDEEINPKSVICAELLNTLSPNFDRKILLSCSEPDTIPLVNPR